MRLSSLSSTSSTVLPLVDMILLTRRPTPTRWRELDRSERGGARSKLKYRDYRKSVGLLASFLPDTPSHGVFVSMSYAGRDPRSRRSLGSAAVATSASSRARDAGRHVLERELPITSR